MVQASLFGRAELVTHRNKNGDRQIIVRALIPIVLILATSAYYVTSTDETYANCLADAANAYSRMGIFLLSRNELLDTHPNAYASTLCEPVRPAWRGRPD